MRRASAAALVGTVLLALTACDPAPTPSPGTDTAATPLTPAPPARDELLTLDTHVDIPLNYATPAVDPLTADEQVNLQKMRSGGLDAAFFIVYVGQAARTPEGYAQAQRDALTKFTAIHRMTEELYPDLIELAYTAADVERIAISGKLVAAIGIENGFVLGPELEMLDRYYELGARYVTLVHNGDNDLGRSAQPRADLGDSLESTAGLTPLGLAAVERMNRLGIMVDVSHAAKQTALDAIRASRAPVIASHSAVTGVSPHPRNMDDETLFALRDNGGVVQIVAFDPYVRFQPPEQGAALLELRARVGLSGATSPASLPPDRQVEYERGLREIAERWPPATVDDLVDHIDHAVRTIGIEHVGISSDFGGGGGVVGWNDAAETANVTTELRARGYDEAAIRRLWSGNLLRVWRDVERVARELGTAR